MGKWLKSLELTNFKKLTGKWVFKPGQNVLLGENGTGKTTMYDAECWLRTGKDSHGKPSHGRGAFDIQTIAAGKRMNHAEHIVEAVYDIDGEELAFERTHKEKWTKKRGSATSEFTGHETFFRLDGKAKTKKKDFDAKVEEVFGGEVFKLVTDQNYLASLPWERRREILIDMAGDINKEAVIDEISGFREMLDGKTPDEQVAINREKRKSVNEELKNLPSRIDEHKQHIARQTETSSLDEATRGVQNALEAEKLAKANIEDFERGENSDENSQLSDLYEKRRNAVIAFQKKKDDASAEWNKRNLALNRIRGQITENDNWIEAGDSKISGLKGDYTAVSKTVFQKQHNECRFCGKAIACPHCDEKDEDGEKNFLTNKSEELKKIQVEGKSRVQHKKKLAAQNVTLKGQLQKLQDQKEPDILSCADTTDEIGGIQLKIESLEEETQDEEVPPELIKEQEDAILALADARRTVATIEANQKSADRVTELEGKIKSLSSEYDGLEQFFFLFDQYTQAVATQTEGRVNQMFDYVRFRMFETQVNGGINPVCDILNDELRPYETALSTGEKIKAGLDIIKTFSAYHQVSGPIFIDHAESFTSNIEMDCQTVELRASVEHKELTQL